MLQNNALHEYQHNKSCHMSTHIYTLYIVQYTQMPHLTHEALKDLLCQTKELSLQFAI